MIPKEYDISTYDYILPDDRIAEVASHPPESAKMLCFHRATKSISHEHFSDFPSKFSEDSLIFLNDTRVIPSRVHFENISFWYEGTEKKKNGEIFFLEMMTATQMTEYSFKEGDFRAMVFPGKAFKVGTRIAFSDFAIEVVGIVSEGRILRIVSGGSVQEFLAKYGKLPLPPYIEYSDEKAKDYQTDFAQKDGSLAAPTASLHFSKALLEKIYSSGAEVNFLTLHVGLGTFMGMKAEDIREHVMHGEYFEVPLRIFAKIAAARTSGKRIIGVGTTVIRTLESLAYLWK